MPLPDVRARRLSNSREQDRALNKDKDNIPRSIQLSDFLLVFTGFIHNLVSALHTFTDELLELATYNAIRKTEVNQAWEQFTVDLETMEDENG